MKTIEMPNLPVGFEELFTDDDHLRHEAFARASVADIAAAKPELAPVDLAEGSTIMLSDLRAPEEADPTEAVVVLYPFGNGDNLGQFTRALYDQAQNRGRRYLLFPNNTQGENLYEVPRRGMASKHLAGQIVEATTKLGIERVHIKGASQGAMVGARMLELATDDLEVVSVSLEDAPNTVHRTPKQLKANFKGEGLEGWKNLNQAVNDSGVPALTKIQHAGKGFGQRAIQMVGFAQFDRTSKLPVNRKLQQDMQRDDLVTTLGAYTPGEAMGRHLSVVRMADSLVCPTGIQIDMKTFGLEERYTEVPGYGHEGMDNIVLSMLLSRIAINGLPAPAVPNTEAA